METRTRLILLGAGLPEPRINEPLLHGNGSFVCLPDMSLPEFKVVIEYDGDIHRTDPEVWRRDVAKRQALHALGWSVITVIADDVLRHPTRLINWVREALNATRAPNESRISVDRRGATSTDIHFSTGGWG